jgi:putative membrane protein
MTKENPGTKESIKVSDNHPWQRLSPIAIFYFSTSVFKVLIDQFIVIAPSLIIIYANIKKHPGLWLPILFIVIALLLSYAILSYYVYRFRLKEGHVEIRSGIFFKKHINLPFSRIQNIKLEQPIYYRMTNFACLQLDTAGSAKQEARLVALPLKQAEDLTDEILMFNKQAKEAADDSKPIAPDDCMKSPEDEVLLNQRSISDLVKHGISSNRIWIFLGMLAPFYNAITENIGSWLSSIGLDLNRYINPDINSWWQIGVFAITATMLVMLVLALFSVLGAIIAFYGFTLTRRKDNYIRRSGLLTKHEVNMKLSRLQLIFQKQDWLDKLFKRSNLRFEQVNATPGVPSAALTNKIVVPSVTAKESQFLIDDAYPQNILAATDFSPINKRFIRRYIGYLLFPLHILPASILVYSGFSEIAAYLLIPFSILSLLVVLRWYRWGFSRDANFIYIRKGLFGVDYLCFKIFKIQQTKFRQSIFQKRHHLCSISLVLASGAVTVPYIAQKSGLSIINQSLFDVESSRRSWM